MNDESLVNCKLLSAELLKENAQKRDNYSNGKWKEGKKSEKVQGKCLSEWECMKCEQMSDCSGTDSPHLHALKDLVARNEKKTQAGNSYNNSNIVNKNKSKQIYKYIHI